MAQSTTKQVVSATPTVPAGHGNGAGVSARSLVGATITARSVGVGGAQEGGGRMARRGGGRTGSTSRWLGDIQPTPMSPPVLDHPLPLAAAAAAPPGGHGPLSAIHGDGGRAACLGRWLEERAGCHTRWLGLILRGGAVVSSQTALGGGCSGPQPSTPVYTLRSRENEGTSHGGSPWRRKTDRRRQIQKENRKNFVAQRTSHPLGPLGPRTLCRRGAAVPVS